MKYICLGYLEPGKFEGMTEDERHAVLDECFAQRPSARQRTSGCRSTSSASGDRIDPVMEKRQSRDDRRPLYGNQGTAWRHSNP
jgi:predicted Fe-S protein YdhL (DUF1289 family)